MTLIMEMEEVSLGVVAKRKFQIIFKHHLNIQVQQVVEEFFVHHKQQIRILVDNIMLLVVVPLVVQVPEVEKVVLEDPVKCRYLL